MRFSGLFDMLSGANEAPTPSKSFDQELRETDDLIASLGPEGEAFIAKLHDLDLPYEVFDPKERGGKNIGAYMLRGRSYEFSTKCRGAVLFHARIHEGAHAIQFNSVANVAQRFMASTGKSFGIANTTKDPFEILLLASPLSFEDYVRVTAATEASALATTSYFAVLAARETGNKDYLKPKAHWPAMQDYFNFLSKASKRAPSEDVARSMQAASLQRWDRFAASSDSTVGDLYASQDIQNYAAEMQPKIRRGQDGIPLKLKDLKALIEAPMSISEEASLNYARQLLQPVALSYENQCNYYTYFDEKFRTTRPKRDSRFRLPRLFG